MNIVISSSNWLESDIKTLFGDEEVMFSDKTDMPALLAELGVYPSRSEARRAGRTGDVKTGWVDGFKASKKVRLWIWNPSK